MRKTIESYLTLSVADCKRMGYFVPNAIAKGVVSWNREGNKIAEIGFGTNLTGIPVAVLSYSYNGQPIDVTIPLRFHHSNLTPDASGATAGYYYFVCPVTGRSCRKLYLDNGRFVSRHALRVPYEQQTKSKQQRSGVLAFVKVIDDLGKLTGQRNRRYLYRGNITPYGRKVERLQRKYERYERVFG